MIVNGCFTVREPSGQHSQESDKSIMTRRRRTRSIIRLCQTAAMLANFAAADVFVSEAFCNFTFEIGNRPNFLLPEAGPNSPGDTHLNAGNPIVTNEDANSTLSGCNGYSAAYLVGNHTWNSAFIGNDEKEYEIDVFYATHQHELWVRTLQPHMDPSLYHVLNDTTIRLNITCDGVGTDCIEFTANFTDATPYNYTAPFEFNDTCYHGFSTAEIIPLIKVPAASPKGPTTPSSLGENYTIVLGGKADQGLPWSEGFNDDGSPKSDEFWSGFWSTTRRRYGQRREDDDDDYEEPNWRWRKRDSDSSDSSDSSDDEGNNRQRQRRRRLELDPEEDCTGDVAEVWEFTTGVWKSTFQTIDGSSHEIDMFYMQEVEGMNELWVKEIESWMAPSLYNQLQFNYVKLNLTCPSSTQTDSCVIFAPTFTNWSPEVDGSMAGYRFEDPAIPSFDIPDAVPNSPGDVRLTSDASVVTKAGSPTETYCNGDEAEYYGEDGYWYSEFLKSDGQAHELKHIFFPTRRDMYAATIQQTWEPNLSGILDGRTIRIRVWCTNDERAEYLFFRVNGEESTCDDVDALCEDVESSGSLKLMPTFSQCAATAMSAASLNWLF